MSLCVYRNGEAVHLEVALSVQDALLLWQYQPDGVAVAINESFVPRSQYAAHRLNDGDRVEVLAPVQGG